MQEIEERRRKASEFLQRLYEKTVGEGDRSKYVDIAEISHEMSMFPAPRTEALSEEEKDELHESGKEPKEVVLRLKEQGLVKLVGRPNPYYGGQVYITQRGIDAVEKTVIEGQLSDIELRGVVLGKLYEERGKGFISVNEKFLNIEVSRSTIIRISEQLKQLGLIELKTLRGDDEVKSAMGKITTRGIDHVEGQQKIPASITTGYQPQPDSVFVDRVRLDELAASTTSYDLSKLIRLCEELNICYASGCFLAVTALTRAILDYVPPIFSLKSFKEVANNYAAGGRSFRDQMLHLENSSRKIADRYLHTQARSSESLPTQIEVNFRNDLDALLGEIARILK
jgi:hypothetical protein